MYKELFLASIGKSITGSVEFPEIQTVGRAGLAFLDGIESLSLPNCTTMLNRDCIASCANLRYISAPKVTYVPGAALSYCQKLEEVHLDSATNIDGQCFLNDAKLKYIYAPNLQSFGGNWCNGTTALTDLYVTNRTTSQVLAIQSFPGFVNVPTSQYANITWHCSDGTITWDGSAWVANIN